MTSPDPNLEWSSSERSLLEVVYEENHEAVALSRLPGVFRNELHIRRLTMVLARAVQRFEDDLFGALQALTLGMAQGVNLDRWGALVGEGRGGLTDSEYRAIIEGKILAMRLLRRFDDDAGSDTGCTPDNLIRVARATCAPTFCIESFSLHPAGFHIAVVREEFMSDEHRQRARSVLALASPGGVLSVWTEGVTGGLGPPGSCGAYVSGGPVSRIIEYTGALMPAPTTLPRVDSNGSAQPSTFPAGTQDNGYQEKEPIPNSYWNYLFRLIYLWLAWLKGGSVLLYDRTSESTDNDTPAADATEEAVAIYALAADSITTAAHRLLIETAYDITNAGNLSTGTVVARIRCGPSSAGLTNDIIGEYTYTGSGTDVALITQKVDAHLEKNGTDVNGAALATHKELRWNGAANVVLESKEARYGNINSPTTGYLDIDPTVVNYISFTLEWSAAATDNSGSSRLTRMSISFAEVPA